MSTETTNKKIKIDNGTTFGKTYTDKAIDERLQGLVSTATFTPVKEKANNSLQKPTGLTKTKLVGVGTNGQENIEIGDNLTLANGKLSATGGGSGGDVFDILNLSADMKTYTGTITGKNPVLLKSSNEIYIACYVYEWIYSNPHQIHAIFMFVSLGSLLILDCFDNNVSVTEVKYKFYYHFITMTNSTDNIALYLTIQNTSNDTFTADTLASYFAGKKVLANGNLHGVVPTYIAGEGGIIKVYYRTLGDNNINPTPDKYQDLSSFTITDLVTPVE